MRMSTIALLSILAILIPVLAQAAGSQPVQAPERMVQSPEQEAAELYNNGLRHRDRAWKMEEKAATEPDAAKRAKLEEKIAEQYEASIHKFRGAVEKNDKLYQAWSSLGYALRKSGDYEASLAAYDRALALAPNYFEAVEYRAEAYLGLGRLEEAKAAYMKLFNQDRERSGELLAAMKSWVEEHRAGAGGLEPAAVEEFATWVAQREEIAGQVGSTGGASGGRW